MDVSSLKPAPLQDNDCSHAAIASDQPLMHIIVEVFNALIPVGFDYNSWENRRRQYSPDIGGLLRADIWAVRESAGCRSSAL